MDEERCQNDPEDSNARPEAVEIFDVVIGAGVVRAVFDLVGLARVDALDLDLDDEDVERIDAIEETHRCEDPEWMQW